jgi:hypothetical protein
MSSKNNQNVFEMQTPHLALFLARSNTGKSYLMRYLLHQLTKANRFNWVSVISPTAVYTKEWDFIGAENVTDTFNQKWVFDTMKIMGEIRKRDPTYEGLLILDDCLDAVKLDDKALLQLYRGGRHYGISTWVASQHLMSRDTTKLRSQTNYCFAFKQPDKSIESMQAAWLPDGVEDWKDLRKKLTDSTKNHGCLCIDNLNDGQLHTIRAPAKESTYTLNNSNRKKV